MRSLVQALLLVAAAAAPLVPVVPALAHETREIGDHRLVAGWEVEPAYDLLVGAARPPAHGSGVDDLLLLGAVLAVGIAVVSFTRDRK